MLDAQILQLSRLVKTMRAEEKLSLPLGSNPDHGADHDQATQKCKRAPVELITDTALPRYVECSAGSLSFRVGPGARMALPTDPTTPEFRAAYNSALVDAIAAEDDNDE
jgi:hypothetical protein